MTVAVPVRLAPALMAAVHATRFHVELEPLAEPEEALLEPIEVDSIAVMPILEEEPTEDGTES